MYDDEFADSAGTQIIDAPRENSVNQARWVLMPLFGLWIMFSVVGVIFG